MFFNLSQLVLYWFTGIIGILTCLVFNPLMYFPVLVAVFFLYDEYDYDFTSYYCFASFP